MSPMYSTEPRPSPSPPTKIRVCGFRGEPRVNSKETILEVCSARRGWLAGCLQNKGSRGGNDLQYDEEFPAVREPGLRVL